MPNVYKTITKTKVSTQTSVLIAVVALAAFGLAAYGYGLGYDFKSSKKEKITTSQSIEKGSTDKEQPGTTPKKLVGNSPIVEKIPLLSTKLSNKELEIYKFRIKAKKPGILSVKQMIFKFEKTADFILSGFKLKKDSNLLPSTSYYIDCFGCFSDSETDNASGGYIIVGFTNEETFFDNGTEYTLSAIASGTLANSPSIPIGSQLTVAPYHPINFWVSPIDYQVSLPKGYLAPTSIQGVNTTATVFGVIKNKPSSDIKGDFPGSFLWSDFSVTPHKAVNGSVGGSGDWFPDVISGQFDPVVDQSQTLISKKELKELATFDPCPKSLHVIMDPTSPSGKLPDSKQATAAIFKVTNPNSNPACVITISSFSVWAHDSYYKFKLKPATLYVGNIAEATMLGQSLPWTIFSQGESFYFGFLDRKVLPGFSTKFIITFDTSDYLNINDYFALELRPKSVTWSDISTSDGVTPTIGNIGAHFVEP